MERRTDEKEKCQCSFCRTYDRYIWAVISECKCGCHRDSDLRPIGHDSLCCEFTNGRASDNPYTDLRNAKEYQMILDLMKQQDNFPLARMNNRDKEYASLSDKVKHLIKKFGI